MFLSRSINITLVWMASNSRQWTNLRFQYLILKGLWKYFWCFLLKQNLHWNAWSLLLSSFTPVAFFLLMGHLESHGYSSLLNERNRYKIRLIITKILVKSYLNKEWPRLKGILKTYYSASSLIRPCWASFLELRPDKNKISLFITNYLL